VAEIYLSWIFQQAMATSGNILDNVVLFAVPEPSTWGMMTLVIGGSAKGLLSHKRAISFLLKGCFRATFL
jgi:hypothetical protein